MSKQFTVKVPTINLVGLVAPIVRKIDDRKSYKAARETMKGQMIEEGRLIRFQAQVEEDLRKEQEKLAKEAAKAAEAEKVEKVEVEVLPARTADEETKAKRKALKEKKQAGV